MRILQWMEKHTPISDGKGPSLAEAERFETIVEMLRRAVPLVQAIYLFGSQAKGRVHRESDIDLAILAPEPVAPEDRLDVQEELSVRFRSDVDLVDLMSASTVMRMQVVTTGSLLFEDEPAVRHFFEMRTLSAYALLNEERTGLLEHVRRRGRIYGR
ncbi:MAG: nucleotidyltransferase domain-containing protein [Rhodothermales bacterium]